MRSHRLWWIVGNSRLRLRLLSCCHSSISPKSQWAGVGLTLTKTNGRWRKTMAVVSMFRDFFSCTTRHLHAFVVCFAKQLHFVKMPLLDKALANPNYNREARQTQCSIVFTGRRARHFNFPASLVPLCRSVLDIIRCFTRKHTFSKLCHSSRQMWTSCQRQKHAAVPSWIVLVSFRGHAHKGEFFNRFSYENRLFSVETVWTEHFNGQ